jgi:hypothetical protein
MPRRMIISKLSEDGAVSLLREILRAGAGKWCAACDRWQTGERLRFEFF